MPLGLPFGQFSGPAYCSPSLLWYCIDIFGVEFNKMKVSADVFTSDQSYSPLHGDVVQAKRVAKLSLYVHGNLSELFDAFLKTARKVNEVSTENLFLFFCTGMSI